MTTLTVPALEPGSFDFMSLVVFRRRWGLRGGSFTHAFQNYPPVFRNQEMRQYEVSLSAFAVLLDAYRTQIDKWSPAEARRFAAALLRLADGLMHDQPDLQDRADLMAEDGIRADERRRCVEELRNHSKERMDQAVARVAAGNEAALAEVSFAATLDRASRLLESGELTSAAAQVSASSGSPS